MADGCEQSDTDTPNPDLLRFVEEFSRHLDGNGPTRKGMMEGIVANQEEHADGMETLLETVGKAEKQREH
ncbi:MAG: hypothetical protein ACRD2O_11675 [Terriglobia bacterium]